jgi:hypothetical protein
MPAQRAGEDAIERDAALGEILAEPARLAMAKLGQPVVVVGAERRLRMPHQIEFRHRSDPLLG